MAKETTIAGRGLGGKSTRVTTTNPDVVALLERIERLSYGRECARQGTSRTWFCGAEVVRRVEELLAS